MTSKPTEVTSPDIKVGMDEVVICGYFIPRPDRIARSVWLAYWEKLKPYIERS